MPKIIILFTKQDEIVSFFRYFISVSVSMHVVCGPGVFLQLLSSIKPDCVFIDVLSVYSFSQEKVDCLRRITDVPLFFVAGASRLSKSSNFLVCLKNIHVLKLPDDALIVKKILGDSTISEKGKRNELEQSLLESIEGSSPEIFLVRRKILIAASHQIPVLLLGESGTGKSLVADIIHRLSSRRRKVFYQVNIASISSTLGESELFGNVKGAFTGSEERAGYFLTASGGTLFLDEIGDIDVNIQKKLLQVIESGVFRRVGSDIQSHCDVRLIFATNADLKDKMKKNLFREDLFYRISRFQIKIPPLREHKIDIPILCESFLQKYHKRLSSSALDLLLNYSWPGNIRQLHNCLENAVLNCESSLIDVDSIFID